MKRLPVCLLLSLIFALPAFATQKKAYWIKLGPIEVLPGISIGTDQDDNIFDDYANEQHDTITTIFPSLGLRFRFGPERKHALELSYGQEFSYFGRWERENYRNKNLLSRLVLEFPARLYLELQNNRRQIITPSSSLEESELGPRRGRTQNESEILLGYKLSPRTRIELSYLHRTIRFDEPSDDPENRRDDISSLTLYYRILPKTSLLLEGRFGRMDYVATRGVATINGLSLRGDDTSEDSRFSEINVGLSFDPTAKLTGTLKCGIHFRDFINRYGPNILIDPGPVPPLTRPSKIDDTSIFSIDTDLRWNFSARTRIDLRVFRGVEESAFTGVNYWVSTRISLSLSQQIGRKITLSPRIYWENGTFPERSNDRLAIFPGTDIGGRPRTRKDTLVYPSFEVRYQIWDWLDFYVAYSYRLRDSNFQDRDSRRQHFTAGFSVAYF